MANPLLVRSDGEGGEVKTRAREAGKGKGEGKTSERVKGEGKGKGRREDEDWRRGFEGGRSHPRAGHPRGPGGAKPYLQNSSGGLFSLFRVFPSSPPKAKVSRGVEASLDEAREVAAIPPIRLTSQPQVRCRRC